MKWMAGKKTYLLAALVTAVVLLLVFTGRLTPDVAMTVYLVAIAGFACTYRDALARHHDQVMALLKDAAKAGRDYQEHQADELRADAIKAVRDAATLGCLLAGERG